ncbi:MAG: oligosaccharide flippase family protein [Lentisphaeraceae bacterium]|nr:oligosaccharide flippase family protein [Lentisphaeraceae bacterium]
MIELLQITVLNVFAKVLKFIFEIGTSFFVDKETYGEFSLVLSYIIIYTKIVTFGIQNILVREIPKYSSKKYISYIYFNALAIMLGITALTYGFSYCFDISVQKEYPCIPMISLFNGGSSFKTHVNEIGTKKLVP